MPRLTREESRLQTREKLMLAAAKMFAREGLGGASIDRIAEEAGYTKGAFYSNFDSKEDIFLQLIETTTRQNIEKIETALAGVSDPEEIIEAVCAWANSHTHEPDMRPLVLDLVRHAKQYPVYVILLTHRIALDRRRAALPAAPEPFLARRRAAMDRAAETAPRYSDQPARRSGLRRAAAELPPNVEPAYDGITVEVAGKPHLTKPYSVIGDVTLDIPEPLDLVFRP